LKVDFVLALERRPDLGDELVHFVAVGEQQEGDAREQGSCCLGAADDEEAGVRVELLGCESLGLLAPSVLL
jgi:hypothetical protein